MSSTCVGCTHTASGETQLASRVSLAAGRNELVKLTPSVSYVTQSRVTTGGSHRRTRRPFAVRRTISPSTGRHERRRCLHKLTLEPVFPNDVEYTKRYHKPRRTWTGLWDMTS